MIRIKREELARYREIKGWRHWSDMARAMGVAPEALTRVLAKRDASGVRIGTFGRMCDALSTPGRQIRLEDLVEHVPQR